MAEIYTKGSEKTRVLAPREGAFREFDIGSDWTEMRVGWFLSSVAATGPNDNSVNESYVPVAASDYLLLGIKNAGQTLPGEAGCLFLGIRSSDVNLVQNLTGLGQQDSSGSWKAAGYHDTTSIISGSTVMGATSVGQSDPTGATGYCNFIGIKFVINNRGLATQTVTIRADAVNAGIAGNDYSAEAARVLLNSLTFTGTAQTIAWNDGAAARTIPDSIFIRSPLFNNCIRCSAYRFDRYA
jgi:hypothetical protein